nr:CAAX amino terminal membrane protease family protein [Streptococcus thermophilus]
MKESLTWQTLAPPRDKDALVAVAAILSMYALLIGQAVGLWKLQVGRSVLIVALPFMMVIALGLPAWLLLRYMRNRGIETGFLPLGRRGWHLLWQVPAIIIGSGSAAAFLGPLLGLDNAEGTSAMEEAGVGRALPIIVALAAYLIVGPFLEELVFHRILMGYFDTVMPAALSVILSSVLFGLAHVSPPAILYTTFFGIGCALATRWHGTLWAGLIAHVANNALVQLTTLAVLLG